jgi:hypothetical protein
MDDRKQGVEEHDRDGAAALAILGLAVLLIVFVITRYT